MIFINTRPTTRAKILTAFLQSQGVNVLELPLLELVACELAEQEKYYLNQLNDYHALIFISETAVTYFFNFINKHQISLNPNLVFITVGQKTADIFKNFWQKITDIPPNIITPSQFNLPENNEGLLQLPFVQNLNNRDKILILKGKDGRALLKNMLLEKGINVHAVDFYQRIFPSQSEQIFQSFSQGLSKKQKNLTKPTVLITSLTAWQHWQDLIPPHFALNDFNYLVLQQRIADEMVKITKRHAVISVIDDLQPNTMLHAIHLFKEKP